MFRRTLNFKTIVANTTLKPYRSIRHINTNTNINTNTLQSDINHFIDNTKSFYKLKCELSEPCSNANFREFAYPLITKFSKIVTDDEIVSLRNIVAHNNDNIPFNEFGYYKHIFLQTSFLNANLIVWNNKAKTNTHYHSENGCLIYKMVGNWCECIFYPQEDLVCTRNFIKEIKAYTTGDICFIDNNIGSHRVSYLDSVDYGLSINIYSPG